MSAIDTGELLKLPLADIQRVIFYKRDEVTTDLICCEVQLGDQVRTFHEELSGWDLLIEHLEKLPGFREDWKNSVLQPPFATSETVAFIR